MLEDQDNKAGEIQITSAQPLIISKQNAKSYFSSIKEYIKETGKGMFEFLEVLKFFDKVNETIKGNSQASNPEEREGDKEFKQMVMDEVSKYGKDGYTTTRGAKFSIMENAGTKYHYENCGDPVLVELNEKNVEILEKIKIRQEFLKTVPISGMEIRHEDELINVYPPYKTSTQTYQIRLPK